MSKIKPEQDSSLSSTAGQEKIVQAAQPDAGLMRTPPKENTSPFHGLWALTNRDLRKWYTNPIQLFVSLIQPVVWLGLFGKALNFTTFISSSGIPPAQQNAILLSYFGTTSYFSFLSCGMLSFIVLFTSAFSGMSVVFDRRFGFLNKALSTPVARGTIVMAKILQSVGRSLVQAGIVLIIAVVLGMDTSHFTAQGIFGAFVVVFLMGMGLSALFTMLALRSADWQTQMAIINLLNLPLLFASNALFPLKIMPTWLQDVVRVNPVSYANDATRQLLIGATGWGSLWVDFAVLIAFAAILSAVGIILSWRFLSK
ncbi:MAG TPA: ABC transporter permease [Candidatus Limnocylindrales bacterium]|nr:ABC transporter permease [Candidatus Limnocylindrales bacterium]